MVGRTVHPEVPPRVEYYLTGEGKKLLPLLEELAKWGRHRAEAQGKIVDSKTGRRVNVRFN